MANQKSKIVDITQSYIPIDPQAFPETLGLTAKEDDPIKDLSILAYEGYNFLPTSYGYRAYFGTDTLLAFNALTTPCDKLLAFQSKIYENALVAFCSDGVYMVKAGSTAWVKIWALTDTWTLSQIYSQYTWCVIENSLYIYRQGSADVLKIKDDLTYEVFVPSFLNMAGQMGIFKANGSLAFWDSENSTAWSNVFDLADFTPSVENQVGSTIFFGVQGRIVHVQDHGDGFVIYATKSIVGVTYSNTSTAVWDAGVVTSESGVAHQGAITTGTTNQEHFVYTSTGIMKIGHYNALSRKYDSAPILPELFDYLKESRSPVYLACHAARFLYFSLVDADYIGGRTSFTDVAVPSLRMPVITVNDATFTSFDNAGFPLTAVEQFQLMDSWLKKYNSTLLTDYTANVFDLPRWIASGNKGSVVAYADTAGAFPHLVNGDSTYNAYKVQGSALPEYGTYEQVIAAANAYAATQHSTTDTDMYVKTLAAALCQDVDTSTLGAALVQTDLYPSDIVPPTANNKSLNTVWDTIFNFFETIDEEMNHIQDKATRLRATVEQLNGQVLTWNLLTSSVPVDADFSLPADVYLPLKSSQVQVRFTEANHGAYVPAKLDIVVGYNKAMLVTFAGTSRNIGNSSLSDVPGISNPNEGSISDFVLVLQAINHYRIRTNNMSLLDLNILLEGKQPFGIDGLGSRYVTMNVLFDDPQYRLSSLLQYIEVLTYHDNGDFFGYVPVYIYKRVPSTVFHSLKYRNAVFSEYEEFNREDNNTYYNVTGYWADFDPSVTYAALITHRVGDPGGVFNSTAFPDTGDPATVCQIMNTMSLVYTGVVFATCESALYTVSNLRNFYYDEGLMCIGATFEWVNPKTSGTYTKLIFMLAPTGSPVNLADETPPPYAPPGGDLYQTEITDTLSVHCIDTLLPSTQFNKALHTLSLTEQGYDTFTKQADDSYLRTSVTNLFTPAVTAVSPYDAVELLYDNVFVPRTSHTMVANSQDCVKWTLTKGAVDLLGTDIMSHTEGTLLEVFMPLGPVAALQELPKCYDNGPNTNTYTQESEFVFPGGTYTLQDGVPIPGYPIRQGALVFDLQLKRWGKFKGLHRALVEYAPINSVQNAVIPYTNFGMDSGILKADGLVRVFSSVLTDAFMRYGKIGYYRFGISRLMEVRAHFRTKSTGKIVIDASLEGRSIDTYLRMEEAFTNTLSVIIYPDIRAKWFTISIHGQFDLQYLEFRGNITSRR